MTTYISTTPATVDPSTRLPRPRRGQRHALQRHPQLPAPRPPPRRPSAPPPGIDRLEGTREAEGRTTRRGTGLDGGVVGVASGGTSPRRRLPRRFGPLPRPSGKSQKEKETKGAHRLTPNNQKPTTATVLRLAQILHRRPPGSSRHRRGPRVVPQPALPEPLFPHPERILGRGLPAVLAVEAAAQLPPRRAGAAPDPAGDAPLLLLILSFVAREKKLPIAIGGAAASGLSSPMARAGNSYARCGARPGMWLHGDRLFGYMD